MITLSAKPDFVESLIDIMPSDARKTSAMQILEDEKFPFTYNVRNHVTPPPGSFPDPGYDVAGFRADTKVAVEMQVHSRNFKGKGGDGGSFGYSFRLLGLYKLQSCKTHNSLPFPPRKNDVGDQTN